MMSFHSVEGDEDLLQRAAEVLGTRTHAETIEGALRYVVDAHRLTGLMNLLVSGERFDFGVIDQAWGGD